ncbi:hypothetical protein [Caballeronia insecticola]|nr:hypothetical protein [Caballeronia insecticola]
MLSDNVTTNIISSADVNFLQSGVGGSPRSVQDKERDSLSSHDFSTVQDAINEAVNSGRQLVIEPGTAIPQVSWSGRLNLLAPGIVRCDYDGTKGPWMHAAAGADESNLSIDTIDFQNHGVVGIQLDAPYCKVFVRLAKNMTAQDYAIAGRQGVVVSQAADCDIDVTAYNFSMGAPLGANAVPRVVTTDGGSKRNKVRIKAFNTHTVWVENGVDNEAEYVIADSSTDNAIYNLDGSSGMKCAYLQYTNGKDEPFVLEGKRPWIGKAVFDGWGFPGVQNCTNASIGEIVVLPTPDNAPSKCVLRTRDGNTQSDVTIGSITGWLTISDMTQYAMGALFQFYAGAIDIRVGRIDLNVKWSNASATPYFILHRYGSIAEYGDVRISFDDTAAQPSQAMYWQFPPSAKFSIGSWNMEAKDYPWIKISNVNNTNVRLPVAQEIFGSVAQNPSLQYPQARSYSDTKSPTSGTWNRGDYVDNKFASPGGSRGWKCTAAGTPGTWKVAGQVGVQVGPSASRPTATTMGVAGNADWAGTMFLDTTLAAAGKTIIWTGSSWVDMMGSPV